MRLVRADARFPGVAGVQGESEEGRESDVLVTGLGIFTGGPDRDVSVDQPYRGKVQSKDCQHKRWQL